MQTSFFGQSSSPAKLMKKLKQLNTLQENKKKITQIKL
jgi:hypothetical protein